jgi:electron transfer flavoprotein beta subunit
LKDLPDQDENHYGQAGSPTRVVRIFPPESDTDQERWEGSGSDLAGKLHQYLDSHKFLQKIG